MTAIFERSPIPTQSSTIGRKTIFGTGYVRNTAGLSSWSRLRATPASSPSATPISDPSAKPGNDRARLAATCGNSSPDQTASTKCRAISDGLKMNSGCPNDVAICHRTSTAINDATPPYLCACAPRGAEGCATSPPRPASPSRTAGLSDHPRQDAGGSAGRQDSADATRHLCVNLRYTNHFDWTCSRGSRAMGLIQVMLGGYLDDLRHRIQDACHHTVQLIKQSSELHDRSKLLTAEAEVSRQEARLRRLIREKITNGLLPRGAPLMIAAAPGDG